MNKILTMSNKGTFTLPIEIRKAFGLEHAGAKLLISFNEVTKQVIIEKQQDFQSLQSQTKKLIKKNKKPLTDVSEFYQTRLKQR